MGKTIKAPTLDRIQQVTQDNSPEPEISENFLPKFEIPLVIKGLKVGVIEAIVMDDKTEDGFPKIMFAGTLIRELKDKEMLVKLLQKEGIHLGKP